ncbi:helix-turn-helix domain-containing protein [Kribbella sp. NPDC056951]|uniref:helix-turn-helix domain-containing protein n=1 Tax=Kribbella sp. NPDC056951 TaxID=3345978 RepID=UPI00363EE7FD
MRQERRQWAAELRGQHRTWVEIASAFADRYAVNLRVALRMAHDWSQREAAERWSERWPSDPKTFKNFSYWEQWPSSSGYAPSLDVLARLAELYDCSIADLVADCADFRGADANHRVTSQLVNLKAGLSAAADEDAVRRAADEVENTSAEVLGRTVAAWLSKADPRLGRRRLLTKLSAALALAAATPGIAAAAEEESAPSPAGEHDLGGIWHSRYFYYSTGRESQLSCEHYVVLRQQGNRLVGENVPARNDSVLRLELTLRGTVATGTWSERTTVDGYYRGREYHGAIQLVVDPMGKAMTGRWVGIDRKFNVNSDVWELQWVDAASSAAQRAYRHLT